MQVKHRADLKIAECVIAILQQYTAMNAGRTLLTILVHMLAIISLNRGMFVKKIAFLCLIVMIVSGCMSSQNTTELFGFSAFEEYIEFLSSSKVEEMIKSVCSIFSEEVRNDYAYLLKKTPLLIPCYNGERLACLQKNDLILEIPFMGNSQYPVSDSLRNDCLHYQSFHKINEETNCTFQFSYIIPSHKEAARQAADIYEYRNATRASSVLDESEELVVKINGTETKCAMWWTSKRKRIQFLWKDMYVVEISAPISKERIMEVLNGLSFEEVSVSVKGE